MSDSGDENAAIEAEIRFGDLILNFMNDKTTLTKKNFSSPHFCCYFIFCFHLSVMRVDNLDDIDRMSFNRPIVKVMGDQVELEVHRLFVSTASNEADG